MDHLFDGIFVVNVPRCRDRRLHTERQFRALGVTNYEFFPAVDGSTLDLATMRARKMVLPDQSAKRDLTAGEVACSMSHAAVWETALARKYRTFLVCEDDASFRADAGRLMERQLHDVPSDWDAIYFYSSRPLGCGCEKDRRRKQITEYVWQGYEEGAGALCYALTARGARFLFDRHRPIQTTSDGMTNWITLFDGYRGYIVNPLPCCHAGGFRSEINAIESRPPYGSPTSSSSGQ
jgi:glycosyl transferase family 25